VSVELLHGDCIEVMRQLPDNSVDAVVTDPPYGLEFMGKEWDAPWKGTSAAHAQARTNRADEMAVESKRPYLGAGVNKFEAGLPFQQWCNAWATEALRVLKPGGHLLAFGGTRTWHRLAVAIEDAGFEVRDSVAWMYGSGFPKSLDVSKAIDKRAGAEREVVGYKESASYPDSDGVAHYKNRSASQGSQVATVGMPVITAPATPAAEQWQGWGTALKPAHEPIVVARKPLIGTVAENVLTHGTGALNIDGCRIAASDQAVLDAAVARMAGNEVKGDLNFAGKASIKPNSAQGRWPANVILDESQAAELDKQSGVTKSGQPKDERGKGGIWSPSSGKPAGVQHGDTGGASRFFYVAKASKKERPNVDGVAHPTVKPLALMRYLVRLVTPPGGTVLEPFAGSGATVEACIEEGFNCIAIERETDYLPLIQHRIHRATEATAGRLL
jgi:DNA modification methylase